MDDIDHEPGDDDGPDDEDDPNVCPGCGGDLEHDPGAGLSWCSVVSCGWTDEDGEA